MIKKKNIVLGGGNTAMDCCRTSKRIGGEDGKLIGMTFEKVKAVFDDKGRRNLIPSFFFSSRRRHTRLQGDWSSDVCSSDLPRVYAVYVDETDKVWASEWSA